MQRWGLAVSGASPTRLKKLRNNLLQAAGVNCRRKDTWIYYKYLWPDNSDPTIAEPALLVKTFIKALSSNQKLLIWAQRACQSKVMVSFRKAASS